MSSSDYAGDPADIERRKLLARDRCDGWLLLSLPRLEVRPGRVFRGSPAPTNLVVPRYSFSSTSGLIIGRDKGGEAK